MRIFGFHIHKCDGPFNEVPGWAVEVLVRLDLIIERLEILMTIAQDLEDEVGQETTVIAGVETAMQNLIDAVTAAGTDGPKLAAVLEAARANKARLAALVVKGTPVATEAPVVPPITG